MGSGSRGDERHPPEVRRPERPPHKPVPLPRPPVNGPPRPPTNGQPRTPAEADDYYDPGVFYLYDNSSPESDYLAGEPCRIVCQSDPSVRCSSYAGQCQGLPDRLICDGETFLCPAIAAPEQPDQANQAAAQPDQACQQSDRSQGRGQGRHHGRHEGCRQDCRQGQAKADVSCTGTNAVP